MRFRPLWFEPTFHKFAKQSCGGVMLHVTDREAFRPVFTTVCLLRAIRELWPDELTWRTQVYEFVGDRLAIDLLFGSDGVRQAIDAGVSPRALAEGWTASVEAFGRERSPYLRYPD